MVWFSYAKVSYGLVRFRMDSYGLVWLSMVWYDLELFLMLSRVPISKSLLGSILFEKYIWLSISIFHSLVPV